MKKFREFIIEIDKGDDNYLPPLPGVTKIPDGHIRLYHQTNKEGLEGIKRDKKIDINKSSRYEGFPAIWASETGFYDKDIGKHKPAIEFHIPKEEWERGGKSPIYRSIGKDEILHYHEPWHYHVRYILDNPSIKKGLDDGELEHIFNKENDGIPEFEEYKKAIRYIRNNVK